MFSARRFLASFPICCALLAGNPNAQAQLPKIFVASFGNDANDGSRSSPKRNFQAAHDAVAANGQIVVLDTAGYGALTITQAIAITVPPGVNGFITVGNGGDGITINAAATDTVSLRGLVIEGSVASGPGNGIYAASVGTLNLDDCVVRNFTSGVYFNPGNEGAVLHIHGGSVRNTVRGVDVQPQGVNVRAIVTGSRLESNDTGLYTVLSTGGGIETTLTGCTLADNTSFGVRAAGGYAVSVHLDGCALTSNDIGVSGDNCLVALADCTVTSNGLFSLSGAGVSMTSNNARLRVDKCRIARNFSAGVVADNGFVTVADSTVCDNGYGLRATGSALYRVDNCRLTGNSAVISLGGSGQIRTRGNNTLEDNGGGNNSFSPGQTYSAK